MTIDPVVDTLARTVWGEARGCGSAGMQRVTNVIINRADHPSWWGRSIVGVCTQPWQFSCRNKGDPNLPKLLAVTDADHEFAIAIGLAHRAVAGQLPDLTGGADSYYALSMKTPPDWATTAKRTAMDAWHAFYQTTTPLPPGARPSVPTVSVHAVPTADELDDLYNP